MKSLCYARLRFVGSRAYSCRCANDVRVMLRILSHCAALVGARRAVPYIDNRRHNVHEAIISASFICFLSFRAHKSQEGTAT
ncbi:hypothetical protein HMPREF9555_00790 [Selenomonas artemidis F0399]|uniref:Uncharacterized protein n=1 Tax=Selenomonas artemidis F0399 TaxID=749551 RepID=E7N1D7_9FIRM|nr:hypothetical protein HMPREF9555_00790 [Selenomonas artemidis F0399]